MATASTIINMASKEIGVKETGVNNVKYNTEYYGRAVNGENYPWCAVFAWWVFKQPELLLFFVAVQKQLQFMKYGDIIIH